MPAPTAEMSLRRTTHSIGPSVAEFVPTDFKLGWRKKVKITERVEGQDVQRVVRTTLRRRSVGDLLQTSERPHRLISLEVEGRRPLRIIPNGSIDNGNVTIPQMGGEPLVREARSGDKVTYVPIDVYRAKGIAGKGSIYEEK